MARLLDPDAGDTSQADHDDEREAFLAYWTERILDVPAIDPSPDGPLAHTPQRVAAARPQAEGLWRQRDTGEPDR